MVSAGRQALGLKDKGVADAAVLRKGPEGGSCHAEGVRGRTGPWPVWCRRAPRFMITAFWCVIIAWSKGETMWFNPRA